MAPGRTPPAAAALTGSLLAEAPKVSLSSFTARQDMHIEEQRQRRREREEAREMEAAPKQKRVDTTAFLARLEESNKVRSAQPKRPWPDSQLAPLTRVGATQQKQENLEAKRAQRQKKDELMCTGVPQISDRSRQLLDGKDTEGSWARLTATPPPRSTPSPARGTREVVIFQGYSTDTDTSIGRWPDGTEAVILPPPPSSPTTGRRRTPRRSKTSALVAQATEQCTAETAAMQTALADVNAALDAMALAAKEEGVAEGTAS